MKKSKSKKMLGFICFTVLSLAFVGCSSKNSLPSTTSGGQSTTEGNGMKPIELSLSIWGIQDGFDDPKAKNDTIYSNLTKKLNLTIKPVQVTWNDFNDKYKVWAASKQLPDIFASAIATDKPDLYSSWAKQGIIKALPDDLSSYPNIKKVMDLPVVQPLKVDGKFYMIPRMTYPQSSDWVLDRSINYRKDWAMQAGFASEPQNFDEFVAMMKAVLKQHPGAAGLTIQNKNFLLTQFLGSFPEMSNVKSWVKGEDGKWVPSYASPRIYQGIKELRTLYEDGLIDKDFAIEKEGDGTNKFLNGQAFADYAGDLLGDSDQFEKANPGLTYKDSVGIMNVWPATDGNRYTFAETPYWSETFFRKDLGDAEFERALKLLDYTMSDEFTAVHVNGIEGIDYKVEGGKSISLLTGSETVAKKYPITKVIGSLGAWSGGFLYSGKQVLPVKPEDAEITQYILDTYKKFKTEDKPAPINFDVMLISTPAKNKIGVLNATAQDDLIKVILGKDDPVKMWQSIIKSYDGKGLQDAINEVNAKVKEMGIK
jgi:putative aldouronate transport system substrate-binding protein